MSAVTQESVLDALSMMQTTLQADGYELEAKVTDTAIEVQIVATPSACAECLVPRSVMEPMVAQMLADKGLPTEVVLHYPPTHSDA
jgi:hypothetical protein